MKDFQMYLHRTMPIWLLLYDILLITSLRHSNILVLVNYPMMQKEGLIRKYQPRKEGQFLLQGLRLIHTDRVQLRHQFQSLKLRVQKLVAEHLHTIQDKPFIFRCRERDSLLFCVNRPYILPRVVVGETSWLQTDPHPNQTSRRMDFCQWKTPLKSPPSRPPISTN